MDTLPPKNTKRWVKSRKLAVVSAIENGELTDQQACEMYSLSHEELMSWKKMLQKYGPEALRTTHLKRYRKRDIQHQTFQIVHDENRSWH